MERFHNLEVLTFGHFSFHRHFEQCNISSACSYKVTSKQYNCILTNSCVCTIHKQENSPAQYLQQLGNPIVTFSFIDKSENKTNQTDSTLLHFQMKIYCRNSARNHQETRHPLCTPGYKTLLAGMTKSLDDHYDVKHGAALYL